MIIVPFVYKPKEISKQLTSHTFHVLCEGGTKLWKESFQSIENVLAPNDLYEKSIKPYNSSGELYHLVEIDTKKTDLKSMFTWDEIDSNDTDTLCWRTFHIFTNKDNSVWLQFPKTPIYNILCVILKTYYSISI